VGDQVSWRAELARHSWDNLRICGKKADHVPAALTKLIGAESGADAYEAYGCGSATEQQKRARQRIVLLKRDRACHLQFADKKQRMSHGDYR